MVTIKISQSYFRCVKLFIHKISCLYQLYRRKYSRLVIVEFCIYHFWRHTIYCSSVFAKLLKNNIFGFSVVFSRKILQISIFKVDYLENGLADFNDFGLILQDFERPFRWNQLVLALQFSFKFLALNCWLLLSAHLYMVVKFCCSFSSSASAEMPLKTLVWSQFQRRRDGVIPLLMSDIQTEKSTKPCGTPEGTHSFPDLLPITQTDCCQQVRNLWSQMPNFPLMSYVFSLCRMTPWSHLPKALAKFK